MGDGNIRVQSPKDQRDRWTRCGQTFSATKGTPFYRLKKGADCVTVVLTLLCHGCPIQAIVAAFGVDERTVASWQARAGAPCQQVHKHLVEQGQVDLGHVQADEMGVKMVGGAERSSRQPPANVSTRPFAAHWRHSCDGDGPSPTSPPCSRPARGLVGCTDNWCWPQASLRLAAPPGARLKWQDCTPAMAAARLLDVARGAFTRGLQATAAISALIALALAIAAAALLRRQGGQAR